MKQHYIGGSNMHAACNMAKTNKASTAQAIEHKIIESFRSAHTDRGQMFEGVTKEVTRRVLGMQNDISSYRRVHMPCNAFGLAGTVYLPDGVAELDGETTLFEFKTPKSVAPSTLTASYMAQVLLGLEILRVNGIVPFTNPQFVFSACEVKCITKDEYDLMVDTSTLRQGSVVNNTTDLNIYGYVDLSSYKILGPLSDWVVNNAPLVATAPVVLADNTTTFSTTVPNTIDSIDITDGKVYFVCSKILIKRGRYADILNRNGLPKLKYINKEHTVFSPYVTTFEHFKNTMISKYAMNCMLTYSFATKQRLLGADVIDEEEYIDKMSITNKFKLKVTEFINKLYEEEGNLNEPYITELSMIKFNAVPTTIHPTVSIFNSVDVLYKALLALVFDVYCYTVGVDKYINEDMEDKLVIADHFDIVSVFPRLKQYMCDLTPKVSAWVDNFEELKQEDFDDIEENITIMNAIRVRLVSIVTNDTGMYEYNVDIDEYMVVDEDFTADVLNYEYNSKVTNAVEEEEF